MAWWHVCDHCGEMDHECVQETCAECGQKVWTNDYDWAADIRFICADCSKVEE